MAKRPFVGFGAVALATGVVWSTWGSTAVQAAAPLHFASQTRQVHLLELYSSEGCDSCPPADAWIGKLEGSPGLWRDFVPVAFHVDYWDYLGWRDPLARRAYSERQYAYAKRDGSNSAYTPEMLVSGQEWKGWRWSDVPAGEAAAGALTADLAGGTLTVSYHPRGSAAGPYTVHVARLGMGVEHAVERGENRGKTLTHNFVALGYGEARLAPSGSPAVYTGNITLPRAVEAAPKSGVAIWVTSGSDPTPLQATGGYLP